MKLSSRDDEFAINVKSKWDPSFFMKQILVVDDSTTLRKMVIASLRSLKDVAFSEACNGLEAIEHLVIAPIDLMILDLNMPDMHGLDVLKFVRKHQSFSQLPIIVLTTKGDETSRNEAIAAGASLYLTKPFNAVSLAQQVQSFVQ